jgi:hypothetical protein
VKAAFLRTIRRPTSLIWVFCHILTLILGFAVLSEPSKKLFGSALAEGIGGSLAATGAAGIVLFLYVVSNDDLREKMNALSKAGLDAIFPHRSVLIKGEYNTRLSSARQIDLVGFGLSAFLQDYSGQFVRWSHLSVVRILLIDPDFPTARHSIALLRDREEGHTEGQTKAEVLQFEKVVRELSDLKRENFQVRRMRALPSVNMFRIADEIFWGPYLMHQQSRNTPTLLVNRSGFLFSALDAHFNALWNMASPAAEEL